MGALDGVRVVETAGIGPAPFAARLLADMGRYVGSALNGGKRSTALEPSGSRL